MAFAGDIAGLEEAVAALAYAAPLQPMAASLKDRLFEKISADSAPIAEATIPASIATLLEQSTQATWQPYPFAPGIEVATVRLDEASRRVDCFVRSLGPVDFPQHCHAGDEEIVVLQGDIEINGQFYGAGDRIQSTVGTVHQPITHSGCTLFLRTSLDDEILV
ncbi:MAG: anti-sigma factor [Leptolyngbyaceae cyanobacterium SM2_5_2]|nr:anti-sigma factor [Leptolyngbyaceae cyanobacterium SM2_5_2]